MVGSICPKHLHKPSRCIQEYTWNTFQIYCKINPVESDPRPELQALSTRYARQQAMADTHRTSRQPRRLSQDNKRFHMSLCILTITEQLPKTSGLALESRSLPKIPGMAKPSLEGAQALMRGSRQIPGRAGQPRRRHRRWQGELPLRGAGTALRPSPARPAAAPGCVPPCCAVPCTPAPVLQCLVLHQANYAGPDRSSEITE